MKAFSTLRPGPEYRREAFISGLHAQGYDIVEGPGAPTTPDDVLLIWNRYYHFDQMAGDFERAGGRVLVAENGYLGHDSDGRQLYALALGHHSGFGRWWVDPRIDRWSPLGIQVAPWLPKGDGHILICGQRGFGTAGPARDWHLQIAEQLRARTLREIRVRPHPRSNEGRGQVPLETDLEGAHACVVWTTASGLHALLAGVPVFAATPRWIGAPAAQPAEHDLELPFYSDRLPMLRRLAWAQWTLEEISAGLPFRYLLDRRQEKAA